MEEVGECLEHKIIRTNLTNMTQLISSDPSAGPMWFAQKLEEKAFIASAVGAVVMGYSTYEQTSRLMESMVSKIKTSQDPKKEFAKFIDILRSNTRLEDLAKKLVEDCGEASPEATGQVTDKNQPTRSDGVQQVRKEITKLEDKFRRLVFDAQDDLSEKESPQLLSKLRTSFLLLNSAEEMRHLRFLKASQHEISNATSVERVFRVLSGYWNYFNYSLLEYVIQEFGSEDLKTKLNNYLVELLQFEKTTKVKDFIHVCSKDLKMPPGSSVIVAEMKAKWEDYTLDHVRELSDELIRTVRLARFTLFFPGGTIGSIILMWAVPSSVVHLLTEAMDDSFLEKHKMEGVTIDGKGLHDYLLEKSLQQPEVKQCPDPQELLLACQSGDLCDVLDLLDAGVPVNTLGVPGPFSGKTPLHYAIERGHHDKARVLLEYQADVNAHDWLGKTPLHYAIERGHHDTVQVLLEHHAEVNAHDELGKTPLHYASERGHHDTVQVLLEQHADVNAHDESGRKKTPLHYASERGHHDTVRVLLEHHADVNAHDRFEKTPLLYASEGGHHDAVRVLLEHHANVNAHDRFEKTPLRYASERGGHDTVRVLLQHHADVNAHDKSGRKKTPLHYASERGHHDTVRVLLEHHADVNAHDESEKKTPLHYGSERGHHDTVRVLLEHHADVNAHDRFENTPLHYASNGGHHDTVRVLLEHHADVNAHDRFEKTPLHYASEGGHHDTVRVLLEHHADVNARGERRKTPLHYANEGGHHDTVLVLLEHHADVKARDMYGRTPMVLARHHPKVIEEFEKYVPGASSRLTIAKVPKPKYMNTRSEHSIVETLKLVPSLSIERQHHWPEYSSTSSEHSTKAKSKSSLEEGTEHETD